VKLPVLPAAIVTLRRFSVLFSVIEIDEPAPRTVAETGPKLLPESPRVMLPAR